VPAPLIEAKISCPACRAKIPSDAAANGQPFRCPSCRRKVEGAVFPALTRPLSEGMQAAPLMENGATCFFHPQNAAHVPCDDCGRFLCALCDLPLGGRHLCPSCIDRATRKPAENPWSSHRFLWGHAALLASVAPALVYPFTFLTFITAPAALVLCILWWKKPAGLTGGGRLPLVLALIFSVVQILVWIAAVFVFVGIIGRKAAVAPSVTEIFFL
jgi:hypothetical protein